MRAQLEAIISELKRRKLGGETHLPIDSTTLSELQIVVQQAVDRGSIEVMEESSSQVEEPKSTIATEIQVETKVEKDPLLAPPVDLVPPEGDSESRWQWLRNRVLNDEVCLQCNCNLHG